jgi:hypothetical protein
MRPTPSFVVLLAAVLGGLLVAPAPAAACGGFFCNNQAIDQSGEQILFVYNDDGTVTTVVSIQYEGPSDEFAWILPVPAEPTVGVAPQELFVRLQQTTAPRFRFDRRSEGECRNLPDCFGWFRGGLEADTAGGPMAAPDDDAPSPPSVEVTFRGEVGPFDTAVLRSGDADALRDWLLDNGYLIPEAAAGELDHYVDLENYFVALRLVKDADAGEIQPITLRSANDEPCIPIRLTRIATVPDMPITAYFLAPQRVVPFNFLSVIPDLDRPGLWGFPGEDPVTYDDVVTETVDDAGGHAFVTDYAGPSSALDLERPDVTDLADETPKAFFEALFDRGFRGDDQLLAIFERFAPPPEGVESQAFYNCITRRWCDEHDAYLAQLDFDGEGLAEALQEAVVEPRREVSAWFLGDGVQQLTRLYTTMSADEMDRDPTFVRSAAAPEVSNVHTADLVTECAEDYFSWTAPQRLEMPGGTVLPVREGVRYYGSDEDFCVDVEENGFVPGASEETLREVAEMRALTPSGGALCAARDPGTPGSPLVALGMLGLLGLGLGGRRRR